MCAASPTSAMPLADERARGEQTERKGAARADHFQIAELQAEALLQLVVEFIVGQRDDALGLVRAFGPHDRGAVARQRQDRERPGGQEMLLGAAFVIALVRDRADDGRLAVIPAVRGDAGLLADLRARAVGADQQPRRDRVAVRQRHVDRVAAHARTRSPRCARRSMPSCFGFLHQRIDQQPVLDHVRERLALLDLAAEGQERRPHRVVELGVRHHHVEDRLRLRPRPPPRPRSPRTAAARPPQSPRRADPSTARVAARDRRPSPRSPRPAPGATRSPAPGRQSPPRRSPRRVFPPSVSIAAFLVNSVRA